MRRIISISYLDYLFLFGSSKSAYTDLCVKSALASGGVCYALLEQNAPAGYLCAAEEGGITRVLYAMTIPEKRNTHIFTELLTYTAAHSAFPVKISISETHLAYETVRHICEKLEFLETSPCMIFSGESKDFYQWEAYMKKTGRTLCGLLGRQGYTCISFEELNNELNNELNKDFNKEVNKELMQQLFCRESGEFYDWLDVRSFLENKEKRMDSKMSFLAVKDGQIAAYTLVRRLDLSSVVFEQIAAAKSYLGSGAILLPFAMSMEMFGRFHCRRCVYAMYEDNLPANAFQKKLLQTVTSSKKRSHNFIKGLHMNKNI